MKIQLSLGKLLVGGGGTQTHRQAGDLISPLSVLENGLKMDRVKQYSCKGDVEHSLPTNFPSSLQEPMQPKTVLRNVWKFYFILFIFFFVDVGVVITTCALVDIYF
jgi:hypothetical protein